MEVVIPKLAQATEKYDVIPQSQHPSFDPQPWTEDGDDARPDGQEAYFLNGNEGPKRLVGGIL